MVYLLDTLIGGRFHQSGSSEENYFQKKLITLFYKRTWKVEEVERKRVERVPQTNAADPIPDKIPNDDARCASGTLSA